MTSLCNEQGDLLLPMLAIFILFGMFWLTYVDWCRTVYWKMRMDVASDLVALSSAREQAEVLNYMASVEVLENPFLPQIKGYGVMDVSMEGYFEGLNRLLQTLKKTFKTTVTIVAETVAEQNGGIAIPVVDKDFSPSDDFNLRLKEHAVWILYVASGWPVRFQKYEPAYYTRAWSEDKTKAQPPHESRWKVCHGSICRDGRARLWLDVDPKEKLNNGGFPSAKAPLLRSIGIQCFYPQFNARLVAKK